MSSNEEKTIKIKYCTFEINGKYLYAKSAIIYSILAHVLRTYPEDELQQKTYVDIFKKLNITLPDKFLMELDITKCEDKKREMIRTITMKARESARNARHCALHPKKSYTEEPTYNKDIELYIADIAEKASRIAYRNNEVDSDLCNPMSYAFDMHTLALNALNSDKYQTIQNTPAMKMKMKMKIYSDVVSYLIDTYMILQNC